VVEFHTGTGIPFTAACLRVLQNLNVAVDEDSINSHLDFDVFLIQLTCEVVTVPVILVLL